MKIEAFSPDHWLKFYLNFSENLPISDDATPALITEQTRDPDTYRQTASRIHDCAGPIEGDIIV